MRYNKKGIVNRRSLGRSLTQPALQCTRRKSSPSYSRGKIIDKFMTRSGYVTVRSLQYILEQSKVSPNSDSPTEKNGKNTLGNGIATSRSKLGVTFNTPETALNAALVETRLKKNIKKSWRKEKSFSSSVVELISYPFKVVKVHQLISNKDFLELLTAEVSSLSFHDVCNDLHEFEQSCDLFESSISTPALHMFMQILQGPLLNWMQDVTGLELSRKITATASKYSHTNYLLCHDDNLSDRSVAFILYLCKDWNDSDGGALQLFNCNDKEQPKSVVYSVFPSFGSFVFFQVTSKSYHQVQEILTKDKTRLSINGWYHGNQLPVKPVVKMKAPKFIPPLSCNGSLLNKWINLRYLTHQYHADIQSEFCSKLSVSLPEFLRINSYKDLDEALRNKSIVWKKSGPAHQRNYEKAKLATLPPTVQEFLKLLKSKLMFYFLSEITVSISPDSKVTPLWHLEVQRWLPGDYTLVVDNDPSSNITGIDAHLYFNVPNKIDFERSNGGTVCYLGPDKDSQGFLEQNYQIEPENNVLFLVAHIAGMKRVTKYINHEQNLTYYKILATYTQG